MGRDLTAINYPFKARSLSINLTDISIRMFTDMKMEITRHLARGVEYVHLAGVQGHIAEFGTATGLTSSCLAMALADARELYSDLETRHGLPPRKLFLFDSFQGLPVSQAEADQGSLHVRTGVWGPGACKALEEAELRQMCEQFIDGDSIQIFSGWYADTLSMIAPGTRFALVHLDCDLYESTRQVLDYLLVHDHLADGCAIFFDDWSCNHASPKYGQRRAFKEWVDMFRVDYDDCGEYGRMSRKIIVHIDVTEKDDSVTGPSPA